MLQKHRIEHEQFMEAYTTEPNTVLKSSLDASLRIWWWSSMRTRAESISPSVWFMGEVSDYACLFSVDAHTHTLTPVTDSREARSLKPEPTRLTIPSHLGINQCLTHTCRHTQECTRMCPYTLFISSQCGYPQIKTTGAPAPLKLQERLLQ